MRRHGFRLPGTLSLSGTFALMLSLSPATIAPAAAQDGRQHFGVTDLDKSGSIDRQEYQRRMVEVYYFADKNKDGVVTIEELQEIETVEPDRFMAADKNGDGKLTVTEFVTFRMVQFDEADSNRDGMLKVEEVQVWEKR